jgi:hypothetical protein
MEMSEAADMRIFYCKRKLKNGSQTNIPDKWTPLYSLVTFSLTPYRKHWLLVNTKTKLWKSVKDG